MESSKATTSMVARMRAESLLLEVTSYPFGGFMCEQPVALCSKNPLDDGLSHDHYLTIIM
jgi:hypothetical protein